jgi:hypothetical protein
MTLTGQIEVLAEKPVPVPLCLPQRECYEQLNKYELFRKNAVTKAQCQQRSAKTPCLKDHEAGHKSQEEHIM